VQNHDCSGNTSAQVAYSSHSPRWRFPALQYTFSDTLSSGLSIQFVAIDTIALAGSALTADGKELRGFEMPGPTDLEASKSAWTWVEDTLSQSVADFLVVFGHFPVWSGTARGTCDETACCQCRVCRGDRDAVRWCCCTAVCENGPTPQLVEQLKPLLEKYRASAYVSGHDHCQVHVDEGTGVQYHVSGGGHDLSDSTASEGDVPPGSLKFHYGAPPSAKAVANGNDNLGAFASATFVRAAVCLA
jgi:tartrate-resistant acid phosphatase type 5